jgi:RHS repeat-associated protein
VILLAEHDESTLAAKKKRQPGASSWPTSTPKNRVWGFANIPSGRPNIEAGSSWENATGSVQYTYQNASGRAEWLSRDPSGETSGINLYAYCGENPICNTDSSGLCMDDADVNPNGYNLDNLPPSSNPDPLTDPNFDDYHYPPASVVDAQEAAHDQMVDEALAEGIQDMSLPYGAAASATAVGVRALPALISATRIDGPGQPNSRDQNRLLQIRIGNTPIIRLDINNGGGGVHLNIGPGSTNLHVPIWPPGAPYFGGR